VNSRVPPHPEDSSEHCRLYSFKAISENTIIRKKQKHVSLALEVPSVPLCSFECSRLLEKRSEFPEGNVVFDVGPNKQLMHERLMEKSSALLNIQLMHNSRRLQHNVGQNYTTEVPYRQGINIIHFKTLLYSIKMSVDAVLA
ncbi:uncharacterized, partial [Tachysurus ichikawai]